MLKSRHSTEPGSVLRRRAPARRPGDPQRRGGQTIVEFALVVPLFVVLLIGIIEFGFALNAVLAVNFATREAALVAAEAGNGDGADCVILQKIEDSISAPAEDARISSVLIFKSDRLGTKLATNTYLRTGSTSCVFPGPVTVTVPYSLTPAAPAGENYMDIKRCNVLAGCPANAPLPLTTAVDQIGVEVTYVYNWRTPLSALLNLNGPGYTIVKANSMRMEPIL
jgi:Flp pilus assembly protein TadG